MDRLRLATYLWTGKDGFVDVFAPQARRDEEYLEGAIELVLEGKTVLDEVLWDEVEYLWWGLVDMVAEFVESGHGRMLFPDQPIEVTLTRRRGEWLRFEVRSCSRGVISSSSVREGELLGLLRTEGVKILSRLAELNPRSAGLHDRAISQLTGLGRS